MQNSKLLRQFSALLILALLSTQVLAGKRTTTYMHTDALGSVVAASDKDGNLLWRKQYMPFGSEINRDPNLKELSYTGKKFDAELGLSYSGARYYDPSLGRFGGIDPATALENVEPNPMMFNRYAYANNNPYKFMDPDGRASVGEMIDTAAEGCGAYSCAGWALVNGLWTVFGAEGVSQVYDKGTDAGNFNMGMAAIEIVTLGQGGKVGAGVQILDKLGDAAKGAICAVTKSAARLCFVEGTPVHIKGGVKPIEEIEIGDLVASKNDQTGKTEWKPVVELFRNNDKEVLNIGFTNLFGKLETLGVTAEHPFRVESKGWTNAGDLAIGDEITTLENGVVKVASIATDAKKHTTYNFEVEDFHTYFVGESALWVHNMCADDVVEGLARSQPNLFKNFNCDACAQGIANALKNEGISGPIVRLQVTNPGGASNLVFFGDKVIGRSGFHEFVVTGGKVFDNLNPRGIPIDKFNSQLKFNGPFEVIEKGF